MMRHAALLTAVCLAGPALAQCPDNTLYNGSFEIEDSIFAGEPEGWRQIPQGDPIWSTQYARTGTYSFGLAFPSGGTFLGFDTFLNNINTGDLYDPPYVYDNGAGGDLIVSGYYLTPVGQAVGPDGSGPDSPCGIKLEFRRDNSSIYQAFEFNIPDADTNGQWEYFEIVFTADTLTPDFPPFATSVSILPFRFDATGLFAGEIYWDDLCVYQVADNPCPADVNGDGVLDNGDIGAFVQLFLASDLAADFNNDGILDNGDIGAFVAVFLAGCA